MKYNFKKIEKKWQKKWEQARVFEAEVDSKKVHRSVSPKLRNEGGKFYVMEMFPYPSATGLHLGHALNYTIGDILARFKRMNNFNVLYPMGFDALGLPAENAAIKVGEHPKSYTETAIKNYIKQMKNLGLSYDWSKMVSSMEPEYYKWNQMFFLKFLEKGLAYRKKAAVNWCPKCDTVLANEQVHQGRCWRHEDTEVEIKHLEQWFLKITDYADELLDCIDDLQWPQKIKTMQKNWIGKSYGTEIDFEIENGNSEGKISNVVIVHGGNEKDREKIKKGYPPQNERHFLPWVKSKLEGRGIKVYSPLMPKNWKPEYKEWKNEFEKIPIDENSVLIGHSAGGGFLVRWLGETKKKIKKLILVVPAIIHLGEWESFSDLLKFKINRQIKNNIGEVIIFVSDNESKYMKESVNVFSESLDVKPIELKSHGHFTLGDMGTKEFPELLEEILSGAKQKFPIFTTRPDTIYGVTFMVISAQHGKLMDLVTKEQKKEVEKFLKKIKSTKQEDRDKLDKEGVFTGSYAINPITKEKVPIWAGNFVVAEYGSGMVMAVPAHDQRDFEFAKKYDLPVRRVIAKKDFARSIIWGSEITKKDLESIGVKIIEEVKTKTKEYNEVIKKVEFPIEVSVAFEKLIQNKLPKGFWNEYVGQEGIIFNFKDKKGNVDRLKLEISNESEIDKKCYEFFYEKKIDANWKSNSVWKSLACAEDNFYRDLIVHAEKGMLENSDKFNGLDNETAKKEITKFLEKKNLGRKKVQFKMRDWLISRQRYWGTPIPVVYCEKCGIVPVSEKDLPIKLPIDVKFGKGNPLATNEKFVNVKCLKCGGKARRETDTMDTFVDSSWYFMRYPDNKNKKVPFDKKVEEYWLPVDQYIGGIEHATMHLLYARFWTKALRDLGYINYCEPFTKLFNQGMLHGEDGNKMSKSIGNVILPEVVSEKYGIDTARFFLMSLASPDKARDWSDKGVQGSLRFINKVMDYFENVKISKADAKIESKLNKTIKEITEYIEDFKYNLAVIKLRELFSSLPEKTSKDVLEKSLKLLHPFCPHITEELWEKIGGSEQARTSSSRNRERKEFITTAEWPICDEKKIDERFEKEEQAIEKLKKDILHVKELTGKIEAQVYVYVLPNELEFYKEVEGINIFAVNDKNKHDPENKSKNVKPGRPGIYLE